MSRNHDELCDCFRCCTAFLPALYIKMMALAVTVTSVCVLAMAALMRWLY